MNAGDLNQRIAIQSQDATQDALGQPVVWWDDVVHCWASIKHQRGMAVVRADAQSSTVKASIRIRYRTDIDATMRVVHGATVYQIMAVLPDERTRDFIDLVCEVIS